MKYKAYPEFIDYLFSDRSKTDCYGDLRAYLTKSGSYETFEPAPDTVGYPFENISDRLLQETDFDYQSTRLDSRPRTSDSNALTNETDGTYEEVFNVAAKTLLADDPSIRNDYVNAVIAKAKLNEQINPVLRDREGSSDIDYLQRSVPLSSGYSEKEYDMLGIPLTFLNDGRVSVRADDLVSSGSMINIASGCLIGVQKAPNGVDCLYPIGFIDFESVMPCTRYEVKFDPQGFLQLM
jgi:hypothetical protein